MAEKHVNGLEKRGEKMEFTIKILVVALLALIVFLVFVVFLGQSSGQSNAVIDGVFKWFEQIFSTTKEGNIPINIPLSK